jgi:hypothetical protein
MLAMVSRATRGAAAAWLAGVLGAGLADLTSSTVGAEARE